MLLKERAEEIINRKHKYKMCAHKHKTHITMHSQLQEYQNTNINILQNTQPQRQIQSHRLKNMNKNSNI